MVTGDSVGSGAGPVASSLDSKNQEKSNGKPNHGNGVSVQDTTPNDGLEGALLSTPLSVESSSTMKSAMSQQATGGSLNMPQSGTLNSVLDPGSSTPGRDDSEQFEGKKSPGSTAEKKPKNASFRTVAIHLSTHLHDYTTDKTFF